ncbi:MAG TPA: helix-turn-helix domain-containing protein [Thermoanaerobaculaceae bacterium]|jgi:predicted DNA-binding transcriptional regulator AlpA|nr:helix-turn-helix domain-containing protein [Acidobacteriota bacterium]HPW56377.1 helix-turn-helix domain-containing protein [Thermoanaerobaculaceae bacterium]
MAKTRVDRGRALTGPEAAERLGVSPETLPVWRCRGRGPRYVLVGRSVRYFEADLDDYVDRHTVDPEGR